MQLLLYCNGLKRRTINLKTLLVMKIICLLLFAACLQSGAKGFAQGITISLKNAPIEKVFKQIEQQTSYRFIYTEEAISFAHPVSIEVKNENLENLLRLCFDKQPLTYKVEEKMIIIKVAEEKKKIEIPIQDVRGKVINENGDVLEGVTIAVKNTVKATSTNIHGEFSLKGLNENDVLLVTSVGYYKEEMNVSGQGYILIRLRMAVGSLEETVIKGYYTTSRRFNTGSVSKVTGNDISTQPVSNPLATLQGRVPGLLVTQSNGLPGSNFSVRIRGQNSIQNGNSPLYIIDGVPFLNDADVLTQRSGINASSPFNTINPADIESIEILKDADATAIYGSRGANGVILITTKKGRTGKMQITASIYSGWGKVTRTLEFMNTSQYLEMRHEAFANDMEVPTTSSAYDLLAWDTTRYTDLKELLIGGTAHTDNINLQLTGGSTNTRFTVSGNYYKESTVFPGHNSDNRGSVQFSISSHSDNNKFSLAIVSSYATDKNNLIRQDLTQFINLPPNIPELFNSQGNLNWSEGGFSFVNPLANTLRNYKIISDRLTSDAMIQYRLLSKLKLKINLGYNQFQINETDRVPIASQDPSISPTGSAFFGTNHVKNWIVEPQVDYDFKIGKKCTVEALAGTSWQQNSGYQTSISGTGYTNDNLLGSTSGAQTLTSKNGNQLYHYAALFCRLNVNFNEKYLINITGRRDGSSRFGFGKQFANFGALGLGWIFSQENFIHKAVPFISFGKLRMSYGVTGNDLIGNYKYLDSYSATQYQYQGLPSLFPTKLYNADYSWEQIRKLDAGLELGFFKDRLLLTLDWFQNRSDNQIINYLLPTQTGFSSVLRNFPGVVQNSGFEAQVSFTDINIKDIQWKSSLTFTKSDNKLISFPGLERSSYSSRYIVGKPLNAYIGPAYAGIDQATGVYQFFDQHHQLTFSPLFADYTYVGTTDPKFYGGIQNTFTYKKWELIFHFEYRKQTGVDPLLISAPIIGDPTNQPKAVLNRWQKPGDQARYEQFTQTYNIAGSAMDYLSASSAILTDASFIRLKNCSFSYSIPNSNLSRIGIEKLRIFFEGQNLFVITNYKGPDPETQSIRSLPPLKMFVTGIQIIL